MKMPGEIKIGGFSYKVIVTDNISLGNQYTGEIDYRSGTIKIRPSESTEYMERTLFHEMLHGIYDFLGYDSHDEKQINELASVLHMVLKDNNEMFNGS